MNYQIALLAGLLAFQTSSAEPRDDKLPETKQRVLAIVGCSVFDPVTEAMLPDRTIVVRGDRIAAVIGPDLSGDIPADAERIDGRGKFAIPGLIDAHVRSQFWQDAEKDRLMKKACEAAGGSANGPSILCDESRQRSESAMVMGRWRC